MKLVMTDVSSLSTAPEREFELPIVKIGRDSDQCHIVFDRVTWPMVSRYHSEFRSEAGKCLLIDANSTFGTFLNGRRVKGSAEVRTGAQSFKTASLTNVSCHTSSSNCCFVTRTFGRSIRYLRIA